jgi:hypothetical protein
MAAAPIRKTVGVYERPGPLQAGLSRWLLVGSAGGALSVLVFHQGMVALLHVLGMTSRAPYSFEPTSPFGVPVVLSLAFWGALWGILLGTALHKLRGMPLLVGAVLYGAIVPTLVAWFVVAPMKGQPVAAGWEPAAMLVGPLVNAAWGFGTGLALKLFGRR